MIQAVNQLFRALRGPRGAERGSADPAARLEDLARRNAELEQAVRKHRKAAEDLRRTQADLARAQRMAKIGNWRWSVLRQELIDGSDAYAEIHGVDRSEIHELMKHQFERVIHPDDHDRVKVDFRAFDESGTDFEIAYRIIRPNGEVRYVREIGENIFGDGGKIVEQIGTVQDVTELKLGEIALQEAHDGLEKRVRQRTEELVSTNLALQDEAAERRRAEADRNERELLLRSAARLSKIGYAVWDELEQQYASVSEEYAQIFGLTVEKFTELYPTFNEDFEAIHPDDRERYRNFDDAYRENPSVTQIEYRFMSPSTGEIIHTRELMQPVRDETGRLIQSILAIQDITDLKQTEEQLRQAQKMEAVGQLTGGIAHDFNNLLAVIIGNLEFIESEIGRNKHAAQSLQTAISAAERGGSLTQRLLAFSRKQALRPESVNANDLVRDMLDLLRRTIGESIETKVVEDEELWKCFVDPNQLENAILNLAINARDAMPTGGTLEVMTSNHRIDDDYARARSDAGPGEYVLITVADTGSGMTEEVQQKAFDPFYTTKDVGQGSGLGLSMVYGFIKQSGGHVNAYSEMGVGTTVSLFLPRYSEEEAREGASNDPADIPKANGEIVLVVEDDSDLRSLLVRILRSLEYRVLNANSGVAALEILNSPTKVDLLFTDLVLPERMAGTVLVEKALRVRPDLRVLYMSGYSDDSIVQHEQHGDGPPFLRKPFRTVDVALGVREALAMPQKLG